METVVKVGPVNTVIPVLDKIRHARIIQDFADVRSHKLLDIGENLCSSR